MPLTNERFFIPLTNHSNKTAAAGPLVEHLRGGAASGYAAHLAILFADVVLSGVGPQKKNLKRRGKRLTREPHTLLIRRLELSGYIARLLIFPRSS